MSVKRVVVTASPKAPRDKTILETPPGKADIQIVVMPMWKLALVRAARTYIQALLTFVLAGAASAGVQTGLEITVEAVGIALPANEFLARLVSAGSLAVGPAIVAVLQNVVEILARVDSTKPGLRA